MDAWVHRMWFWPFCTENAKDPFSGTSPMPADWEEWMVRSFPPKVVVELDWCAGGKDQRGYQRGKNFGRVLWCWRYLFDNYPWLLPAEISRPPWRSILEQRGADLSLPLDHTE